MSVFFYGCITLDGYLADKNHNLDWLYQTGDAEETDSKEIIEFYKQVGKETTYLGYSDGEYKISEEQQSAGVEFTQNGSLHRAMSASFIIDL